MCRVIVLNRADFNPSVNIKIRNNTNGWEFLKQEVDGFLEMTIRLLVCFICEGVELHGEKQRKKEFIRCIHILEPNKIRTLLLIHNEMPEQIQKAARDMIVRVFRGLFTALEKLSKGQEFTEEHFVEQARTELAKLNDSMEAHRERFNSENWSYYEGLYRDYNRMIEREAVRIPGLE